MIRDEIATRHHALKRFSNDHNEVLLLSYRIGSGLRQDVDRKRIKKYVDWFRTEHLEPHFELENKYIFPILGNGNVRMKRALANQRRIKRLFDEKTNLNNVLNKMEDELGRYIRFEERILYNEIQKVATKNELIIIEKLHDEILGSDEIWDDRFWEKLERT
jgi:iron-sulfur cluster repair protein YtfE (RIC family)